MLYANGNSAVWFCVKSFANCKMHSCLMVLSSPYAQQIDSVSCGSHFQIYWHLAANANTNYHPGNAKETLRVTLLTGAGLKL